MKTWYRCGRSARRICGVATSVLCFNQVEQRAAFLFIIHLFDVETAVGVYRPYKPNLAFAPTRLERWTS